MWRLLFPHLQMEESAHFKTQLMDCQEKLHWMSSHVKDLRMQLSQTQQGKCTNQRYCIVYLGMCVNYDEMFLQIDIFYVDLFSFFVFCMMAALENEMLRNSKPSLHHSFLSPHELSPSDAFVDRALLRVRAGFAEVGEGARLVRENQAPQSDLLDYNMDSVAEAKARLQQLQEEAEVIEEAYRAYQQRAVHSTIPPALPPRPLPSTAHPLHHSVNKNLPQTYFPCKTKSSHTSESLQPNKTFSSALHYHTRTTAQPGQPRATSDHINELQTTVFNDYSNRTLHNPLQQSVQRPQGGSSSPSRQMSHKLPLDPRVNLQRELPHGIV